MLLKSEREKAPASAARSKRDFGAEVLRFLAHHGLPATPPNYEIGYAAVATPRSATARAIDAIVRGGVALDQDAADRIAEALRNERSGKGGEDSDRARLRLEALRLSEAVSLTEKALADLARRDVRLRATDEPLGRISFSAGVSVFTPMEWDDAVERADALLYRAKEAGRCCVLGEDRV